MAATAPTMAISPLAAAIIVGTTEDTILREAALDTGSTAVGADSTVAEAFTAEEEATAVAVIGNG